MKKLLLSVLAVLGVASVNAYEVNDFLYTNTAKFKVIGENLVTNGNFNVGAFALQRCRQYFRFVD